jgi:hypothetical protein
VRYRYWTLLLFVAIVVQIGAAGYGAFYADSKTRTGAKLVTKHQFDHGFGFHDALGYIIVVAMILLFVIALGAGFERRTRLVTLAVAVLGVLQIVFAVVGESTPAVGVLHPIDAFVLLGLVGMLTHRAWASRAAAAR